MGNANTNEKKKTQEVDFSKAESFDLAAGMVLNKCVGYHCYQHYSRMESILTKIIQKRWFLTRCSSKKMNDWQEPRKFDNWQGALKRSYVACFVRGSAEDVAMWGLYGKSNPLALRVTIPGKTLEKWMSEIEIKASKGKSCSDRLKKLGAKKSDGTPIHSRDICASVFRDVLYAAVNKDDHEEFATVRSNAVCWRNKYYHFKDGEDVESRVFSGQYAGFIKDYEWNYEKETRLCVELKKDIGEDNISIAIPDYVIENMRFTLSPWLPKENERIVVSILKTVLKDAGVDIEKNKSVQRFHHSNLRGALNFK